MVAEFALRPLWTPRHVVLAAHRCARRVKRYRLKKHAVREDLVALAEEALQKVPPYKYTPRDIANILSCFSVCHFFHAGLFSSLTTQLALCRNEAQPRDLVQAIRAFAEARQRLPVNLLITKKWAIAETEDIKQLLWSFAVTGEMCVFEGELANAVMHAPEDKWHSHSVAIALWSITVMKRSNKHAPSLPDAARQVLLPLAARPHIIAGFDTGHLLFVLRAAAELSATKESIVEPLVHRLVGLPREGTSNALSCKAVRVALLLPAPFRTAVLDRYLLEFPVLPTLGELHEHLHAAGRSKHRVAELRAKLHWCVDRAAKEIRSAAALCPQDVAGCMWAASMLRVLGEHGLLEVGAKHLFQSLDKEPQHAQVDPDGAVRGGGYTTSAKAREYHVLSIPTVVNVVWSLAVAREATVAAVDLIKDAVGRLLSPHRLWPLFPAYVVTLLSSVARLSGATVPVASLAALADRAVALLPELRPLDVAMLLWSCLRLSLSQLELLRPTTHRLVDDAKQLDATGMSMVVHSFATARMRSNRVLDAFQVELVGRRRMLTICDPTVLRSIMLSYAFLTHSSAVDVVEMGLRRALRLVDLGEELRSYDVRRILWAAEKVSLDGSQIMTTFFTAMHQGNPSSVKALAFADSA